MQRRPDPEQESQSWDRAPNRMRQAVSVTFFAAQPDRRSMRCSDRGVCAPVGSPFFHEYLLPAFCFAFPTQTAEHTFNGSTAAPAPSRSCNGLGLSCEARHTRIAA